MNPVVVVQGVSNVDEIPELGELGSQAELRFTCSVDELRIRLPDADVMLCWDYDDHSLCEIWSHATKLRRRHYCAVGLDDVLFPALAASSICATNAQGLFEAPMAEWVLTMILCLAKKIPETLYYQAKAQWQPRVTDTISGKRALIVGVGSIGRAIGHQLRSNGMEVERVGRTVRGGGRDSGHVFGVDELLLRMPGADYVVLTTPYTDQPISSSAKPNSTQCNPTHVSSTWDEVSLSWRMRCSCH